MILLEGMVESGCEGNISWFENRQEKILELITELKPKNLIEIGFTNFQFIIGPVGPGDIHPNWIYFNCIK